MYVYTFLCPFFAHLKDQCPSFSGSAGKELMRLAGFKEDGEDWLSPRETLPKYRRNDYRILQDSQGLPVLVHGSSMINCIWIV